jgi:hypothetical protein
MTDIKTETRKEWGVRLSDYLWTACMVFLGGLLMTVALLASALWILTQIRWNQL